MCPSFRMSLSEAVRGFSHLAHFSSCISPYRIIPLIDFFFKGQLSVVRQEVLQVHDLTPFLRPCAMEVELAVGQYNPWHANISELGKVALVVERRPHKGVSSVGFHGYVSFGRAVSAKTLTAPTVDCVSYVS